MKDLSKTIEPLTKNEEGKLMGGFSKIEFQSSAAPDVENYNCSNRQTPTLTSIENMNCRNACSCNN